MTQLDSMFQSSSTFGYNLLLFVFTPASESPCCALICILFVSGMCVCVCVCFFFFFPPLAFLCPSGRLVTIDCDWVAGTQSHKFVPFFLFFFTFLLLEEKSVSGDV